MSESLSIAGFRVGSTDATHCAMWPASVLSFSSPNMALGETAVLHCVPLRQENRLSIKLAALFIIRCTKMRDVKMRIMKEISSHTCCWGGSLYEE